MSGKLIIRLSNDIVIESATNYVANRQAKIEFNVYKVVVQKTKEVYVWACCVRAYANSLPWSTFDHMDYVPVANYMNALETEQCDEVRRTALKLIPNSH